MSREGLPPGTESFHGLVKGVDCWYCLCVEDRAQWCASPSWARIARIVHENPLRARRQRGRGIDAHAWRDDSNIPSPLISSTQRYQIVLCRISEGSLNKLQLRWRSTSSNGVFSTSIAATCPMRESALNVFA